MKKILIVALLLTGLFNTSNAQGKKEFLAAANKYYTAGDFYSAAEYYQMYLTGKKTKGKASGFNPYDATASTGKKITGASDSKESVIYTLAECYRKLHQHDKAEPQYFLATSFDKTSFPLSKFHYGTTLRALGKYDDASKAFSDFVAEYTNKDQYVAIAELELKNIPFIKQQLAKKDIASYQIEKNAGLNSEGGSYAPVWNGDKNIIFTSTRPNGKDSSRLNRIYQADFNNGTASNVALIKVAQPEAIQQGVVALSPDGNTMFLTRWNSKTTNKNANIFQSKKSADGSWSEPTPITALEVVGSNTQQPFVTEDGKNIIFVSDRVGGFGGLDLWMSTIESNGAIGTPVNMGASINTMFDEQAPSYHLASKTFIFSSNGHVGMGGFDFIYCKGDLNNLSAPKNFGYPVNSAKDDLYFISKGPKRNILEYVVLSSDREASCCLELFSLHKERPIKKIDGTVLSCVDNKPLANVKVAIMDTINNMTISELTTDSLGKYQFTIDEFAPLKAIASNTGYFNNSLAFEGPSDIDEEFFSNQDLCMTKIPNPIEEAVEVDNVYYDFNEASIQESSFASLDKLVKLLNDNPTMSIQLNAHTDNRGEEDYNQKLSDARANSVVNYLVKKGINKTRLTAKGFGESKPIADNENADGTDNPEGRQKNRRTEFQVVKL